MCLGFFSTSQPPSISVFICAPCCCSLCVFFSPLFLPISLLFQINLIYLFSAFSLHLTFARDFFPSPTLLCFLSPLSLLIVPEFRHHGSGGQQMSVGIEEILHLMATRQAWISVFWLKQCYIFPHHDWLFCTPKEGGEFGVIRISCLKLETAELGSVGAAL